MDSELQMAEQKLAELKRQLKEKEQENRIGKLKIKELRRLERQKILMPAYNPSEKSFTRDSTASLPLIKQAVHAYEQAQPQRPRNGPRRFSDSTRVKEGSVQK